MKVRLGIGAGASRHDPDVAGSWDDARRRVERFVDEGITKFVVRHAAALDTWTGFLDGFVEHLVPLEARLSGSPARG